MQRLGTNVLIGRAMDVQLPSSEVQAALSTFTTHVGVTISPTATFHALIKESGGPKHSGRGLTLFSSKTWLSTAQREAWWIENPA